MDGEFEEALDIDLAQGAQIETRVKDLLESWAESITGKKTEVEVNLCSSLKGKCVEDL